MIEAMIILGTFVAWLSFTVFALMYLFEGNKVSVKLIFGIAAFVFTAWLLSAIIESDRESPCVEYETIMMYNAAVKAMMPVRSCKKRGEWVKEQQQ